MPELPEVETVVLAVRPAVTGKTIRSVSSYPGHERVFEHVNASTFHEMLKGNTIRDVSRRGKYVLFKINGGIVAVHLRMTGVLKSRLTKSDNPSHLAVKIDFDDGSSLYFKDYRKFGRFYFYRTVEEMDSFLGVEPLSKSFTLEYFKRMLYQHKRKIKPFLLDQKFIAGLGNIYVDESLWLSKINPEELSSNIPGHKAKKLHIAIQDVLGNALSHSGTTFMSFSFDGENRGEFKEHLNVFGRNGRPCRRCKKDIIKIRVGQRGTHLCPSCQKMD